MAKNIRYTGHNQIFGMTNFWFMVYKDNCSDTLVYFLFFCRANLKIVKELGDYHAQGRTLGNLGNTYYLLGNYKKAIKFHEEVSK